METIVKAADALLSFESSSRRKLFPPVGHVRKTVELSHVWKDPTPTYPAEQIWAAD